METGYAIANISTLKGITAQDRFDGYTLLIKSGADTLPCWYTFIAASQKTPDDDSCIQPNDNSSSGRWLKHGGSSSTPSVVVAPGLFLQLGTAQETGANEVYIFADAADGKVKVRAPNNGAVTVLGSSTVTPTDNNNSEEDDDMADWIIITGNYTASVKDKLLVTNLTGDAIITLPADPVPKQEIKFLKVADHRIVFNLNQQRYLSLNTYTEVFVETNYEEVSIIFTLSKGWVPSRNAIIQVSLAGQVD